MRTDARDEGRILRKAIDAVRGTLPLGVTGAEWASEALTIWGRGWSFSTMSGWRLSRRGTLVASVFHEPRAAAAALIGRNLIELKGRTGIPADDPVLVFDDDLVLEVSVDLPMEPWVFRIEGASFVPSDVRDSRL
jgi:hypothetical protein